MEIYENLDGLSVIEDFLFELFEKFKYGVQKRYKVIFEIFEYLLSLYKVKLCMKEVNSTINNFEINT